MSTHPSDPQHPPDLFPPAVSGDPSSSANAYPGRHSPPYSGSCQWNFPQQTMQMVPPELDPPIDMSGLDRKTSGRIQREVATWARNANHILTKEEGGPLLQPLRNFFIAVVGGTIVGRTAMMRMFPAVAAGPPTRSWLLAMACIGNPLGVCGFYFSQTPAMKSLMGQKSKLGIQARYIYRAMQAEKNRMPPPIPPFGIGITQQGMSPGLNSPYDGQVSPGGQQPQQMMQWNSFHPQPQYPLPPTEHQWPYEQHPASSTPGSEQRFRSWEDIRKPQHLGSDHPDESSLSSSKNH